MTIGSLVMMLLIALWGYVSALREKCLCDRYGRGPSEWAWLCLGLGILFTGLSINGALILFTGAGQ